jgi:hypothetical protein
VGNGLAKNIKVAGADTTVTVLSDIALHNGKPHLCRATIVLVKACQRHRRASGTALRQILS